MCSSSLQGWVLLEELLGWGWAASGFICVMSPTVTS